MDGAPARRVRVALPYYETQESTKGFETARIVKKKLRVKNAGCNEDIAVESAEF
jgi:hypothetical protein